MLEPEPYTEIYFHASHVVFAMLQKTAPLSLLALLLIVVPLQAETLFWPGWLGPNRDGRLQELTPPKSWPESLDKAWQVDKVKGAKERAEKARTKAKEAKN